MKGFDEKMLLGEKIDKILKEFMYEKGRNKNKNTFKDKKTILNNLNETLDEMEEYIESTIKEHPIFKKKH